MQAFIYIGSHKCGSTAMQSCFSQNYYSLKQQKALYPYCDIGSLIYARQHFDHKSDPELHQLASTEFNDADFRSPHNALAFRLIKRDRLPKFHRRVESDIDAIFDLIRLQIKEAKPEKLILISEVMSHFGFNNNQPIKKITQGIDCDKRNICALFRRPDEYLQSWYGQQISFNNTQKLESIREMYENKYKHSCHFNYQKMIKPWEESQGIDNIYVENYSNVYDSVEWFSNIAGLQINRNTEFKSINSRRSIHKVFYSFARHAKNTLEAKFHKKVIKSLRLLSSASFLPDNRKVDCLGSELRERIYEDFQEHHAYLSKFSGGKPFFDDYQGIVDDSYLNIFDIEDECLLKSMQVLSKKPRTKGIAESIKNYLDQRDSVIKQP